MMDKGLDPECLAADFTEQVLAGREADLGVIDQLCEMAMAADQSIALAATTALFRQVIEGLCDHFSAPAAQACSLVLARILEYLRHRPEAAELDRLLNQAGYDHMDQLLERYERLCTMEPIGEQTVRHAARIIVLSRVTVGADVAITSIILQRLARCSEAELVMVGPPQLETMFGGLGRIRFIPFVYENSGTLLAKMTTWPPLLKIISQERQGLDPDRVLLFDPDSRLSQLGLLPLVEEESTCYFPSRAIGDMLGKEESLARLTNLWFDRVVGAGDHVPPGCGCSGEGGLFHLLKPQAAEHGCKFLVSVNLGVGHDERKRVIGLFEQRLFDALLHEPDTLVVLDTGQGGDERQVADRHRLLLQEKGRHTDNLSEEEVGRRDPGFGHGLITFQVSLAGLGALMHASDCFIGYDSCGQHIATAMGVPAVILFAGAPSERFRQRWTPHRQKGRTIPVYKCQNLSEQEVDLLVSQVMAAVKEIRDNLRC